MVAGHDTTASLIGNSVVALLRNPEQLSKLRSEPGTRSPLRSRSSSATTRRFPTRPFATRSSPSSLAASTIPEGAQVIICLAAANRDARQVCEPESLDVDRAAARHLAFGHGVHHCLGAPLARMEGRLALGSLLRRFPELALAVPSEDLHWGHGDGLVLRGLSELPVIPGPVLPRTDPARSPQAASRP